ncbi:hypothetical protein [Azospira restricta]|uniref:Uncharacterized protein n=1 Tax=Azospira restricta TaxID=404405 RepID=A0A974PYH0_9RHOO|nr:hypothetical protein [Azospira restricta]QRJ63616.1 hypothetical protein IWH25_18055 [Azospira restricta]
MKKVILGAVLATAAAASMDAMAVTVCSGGSGTSAAVSVQGGTYFIKAGFTARCSNNVALAYDEDATYMRVGAVSVKGRNMFAGSSVGGAVTGTPCATSGCTVSDAAAAFTKAPTS